MKVVINDISMTGKIYIKTINGLKYRYERLWSKRVKGKVVTKDRCLGAVDPVVNKIGRLPAKRISHYRSEYESNFPIPAMVEEMKEKDGIIVSETTVRNHFKKMGCVRFPRFPETRRADIKEATARRKDAKRKEEERTQHRFEVLMEEKRLTPKQITTIGKGKGLDKGMIDALWKKRA